MVNRSPSSNLEGPQQQDQAEGQRNAWILTAYAIFGLGLVCLIAYAVAQYLAS